MKKQKSLFFHLVITKAMVDAGNISDPLTFLRGLRSSPVTAAATCTKVDISFLGYEDTERELWEIPSVRKYVKALDEEFPYWVYFLSPAHPGLQCLVLCLLEEVTFPMELSTYGMQVLKLFNRRWTPALNEVCDFLDVPDKESLRLMLEALAAVGLPCPARRRY